MNTNKTPPNENEIEYAFRLWFLKNFKFRKEDLFLEQFLKIDADLQPRSWLEVARLGMQKSATSVAQTMGVTPRAYEKYELGEKNKTISLGRLAAAEAMDCELIYVIRPKVRKRFSVIIWEKVLPKALRHPLLKSCDQKRKAFALLYIVTQLIRNPQFRKEQNWSQHKN